MRNASKSNTLIDFIDEVRPKLSAIHVCAEALSGEASDKDKIADTLYSALDEINKLIEQLRINL